MSMKGSCERRPGDLKGPKSLAEWIEVYERRAGDDVRFRMQEDEHLYYHPEHGFFTWFLCQEEANAGLISIPKMCGNGKLLRRIVYEMVKGAAELGIRGVLCCSRRRPELYSKRVLGGKLHHVEYTKNLNTGAVEPMYFYVVSLEDYKGRDVG